MPGSSFENWLIESDLRETYEKSVAIVNSRTDNYWSHGECGEWAANGHEAPELKVRGAREVSDMFRESSRTIQ